LQKFLALGQNVGELVSKPTILSLLVSKQELEVCDSHGLILSYSSKI